MSTFPFFRQKEIGFFEANKRFFIINKLLIIGKVIGYKLKYMLIIYNVTMDSPRYKLDAELTLRVGDDLLANAKRIELLRQIGLTESLTKSAKIAGYSYKGAWDTIEQMTQLTGGKLLERHAGGKGGGRTSLTERGHQLLKNFLLVQAEHARFISRLDQLANGLDADYAMQTEIAMKTSVRNQFGGIVMSILQGPANDEVTLLVNGSLLLTASITHESGRDLQLDIGMKIFALIKASSIKLWSPSELTLPKQHNCFPATVHKLTNGNACTEVALLIDGGQELICTVGKEDILRLAPVSGMSVIAVTDPSNVILGIAA